MEMEDGEGRRVKRERGEKGTNGKEEKEWEGKKRK